MDSLLETNPHRADGALMARLRPGWNGIEVMSRRRSFRAEGPRSHAPPKSRRPRPAQRPRPRSAGAPAGSIWLARTRPGRNRQAVAGQRGRGSGKPERLQKVLAHAGLGSRRACEELILQGRVSVDGEVVRQLGTRVDPAVPESRSTASRSGSSRSSITPSTSPRATSRPTSIPSGRPRVVDLLPEIPERVYTVGRLDEDSTGLMILTNDGDLANRLAHPRYGVEKLYRALVAGLPSREMLAKLTEGIWLSDGKVRAKRARIVGRQGQATMLELVLAEGKKREIRRMLSKLGHKVMSLNRIAVGPISLKGLSAGECRPLSRHEVDLLRKVASASPCRCLDSSTPTRLPGHLAIRAGRAGARATARPRRRRSAAAAAARLGSARDTRRTPGSTPARPPRPLLDFGMPHTVPSRAVAQSPAQSGGRRPAKPARTRPTRQSTASGPVRLPLSTSRRYGPAARIIIGLEPGAARRERAPPCRLGQPKAERGRPPGQPGRARGLRSARPSQGDKRKRGNPAPAPVLETTAAPAVNELSPNTGVGAEMPLRRGTTAEPVVWARIWSRSRAACS